VKGLRVGVVKAISKQKSIFVQRIALTRVFFDLTWCDFFWPDGKKLKNLGFLGKSFPGQEVAHTIWPGSKILTQIHPYYKFKFLDQGRGESQLDYEDFSSQFVIKSLSSLLGRLWCTQLCLKPFTDNWIKDPSKLLGCCGLVKWFQAGDWRVMGSNSNTFRQPLTPGNNINIIFSKEKSLSYMIHFARHI